MKKLYMIGNAHLDPVWLWTWQEGFQENKATFLSMLHILEEYEDPVFTSSSAQFYEWVEENDPEMFERIRKYICEGRWILCGGWWVQPDCNMPVGESFARHALISQNYFKEKFGVIATVGYNVDSFGHNGMLPQILRQSGMDSYVFMRPGPHEKKLPGHNFIWQSPDGSQVAAFRIHNAYCTFENLESHTASHMDEFDTNIDQLMCFYGVGNHGGGPTRNNIETIQQLKKEYEDNTEIVFSDPVTYFKDLKASSAALPVVLEDLQHHAVGCYTVESSSKQFNRKAENALLRAEKFASIGALLNRSVYPTDFTDAWKKVLFNQFHDILAGSSVAEAYEDARNEQGFAITVATHDENNAVQAISFGIHIPFDETASPVVIFNPHPWEITANTEVELENRMGKDIFYSVTDSTGEVYPCQIVSSHVKVGWRTRLAFQAVVPSMGYECFFVHSRQRTKDDWFRDGVPETVLENTFVRVELDKKTGTICSYYNKELDQEMVQEACVPVVMEDLSDTWSHGINRFDKKLGVFSFPVITKIEEGELRHSIRVISKYGLSTMTQIFTLYENSPDLQVEVKLSWQEKFKCLRIKNTLEMKNTKATYDMPFGCIEKACDGAEEPMQMWMDLSGNDKVPYGVSLLNNAKYGASIDNNSMYLTVLRSPVSAHHDPWQLNENPDNYSFTDQGVHSFRYVLAPHSGFCPRASVSRKALLLNQPAVCLVETYHEGPLPQKASHLQIGAENVVVTAFKKAEKQDGYVLRMYEAEGKDTDCSVEIPVMNRSFIVPLSPYSIKTIFIPNRKEASHQEMNLLEWL